MNNQKITKISLMFFIILISTTLVSALSLIAEFENGNTYLEIMPTQSAHYNVYAVADQGLTQMTIEGEFFDETTGNSVFIKDLFSETTTELFFSSPTYEIIPQDYNNLPGDYKIKITAQEWLSNGFYTSKITYLDLNVIGNRPPKANFTFTPQNPTTATPVTFTSTSSDDDGTIILEEWFVNGVKIGEGEVITHTFNQAGTYTIMLRVTDNEYATDSETKIITVTSSSPTGYPIANFTFTPQNPLTNQVVTFTSTSYDTNGQIILEEWDFNNDGIYETTGHIVQKTFTSPGTYLVTLRVTDNSNLQSQITKQVVVRQDEPSNVVPVANFTYSPVPVIEDEQITFTSTSYDVDGYIVSYLWKIDGISIGTQSSLIHTFANDGIYIVSLTVIDDDGASNTISKRIIVNQGQPSNVAPVANFTYSPVPVIEDEQITFTSTSYDVDGYIVSYQWKINGINVGSSNILNYIFATPGTYSVELIVVDDDGASDSESKKIVVNKADFNVAPIANFNYTPINPTEGDLVKFTSTSTDSDGFIVLEQWFIDDELISSGHVLNYIFETSGTYKVTIKVTDNDEASATKTIYLKVGENNGGQNGSIVLVGIGCNPNVIRGDIQHCSAGVADELKDVKLIFKYKHNDETLGECLTNFKGFCHINPRIDEPEGTYEVYALAYKEGTGYDYSQSLTTAFRVWEKRYEIRNMKIYENEFKIQNYTFYRSDDMYVAFDVYDRLTQKYIKPGEGDLREHVFLRINNYEPINMQRVGSISSTNFINRIYSAIVPRAEYIGAYKYKLDYIPITDDLLGQGKVFAFVFNKYNQSGQGSRDVTVLNNPVHFTPPEYIIIDDEITVDFKDYLFDIETPLNEIIINWGEDTIIDITHLGDNVLKFNAPNNFHGNVTITFIVDDTDGSIVKKQILFTDKFFDSCAPRAVLSMPESVTVQTTVLMDASESYAGCNAYITSYQWQIFKRGEIVATFYTTIPEQSYTFNSNAEYKIVLTIFTSNNMQDSDESLLFAGRVHQDVTFGKEDDLFVDYFSVTGEGKPYGVISCGELFEVSATVSNDRDDDIEDLKIIFSIPEIGYKIESSKFDLDSGDTETIIFEGYLDYMIDEVPPGEYIAMIGASDTDTLRNKYFPLIIE